jgi:hypothetical protein
MLQLRARLKPQDDMAMMIIAVEKANIASHP